MGDGTTRNI